MEEQKTNQNPEHDPELEAKLPPEALAQLPDEPEQPELPEHVANQALPQTEQLILPPKKSYKKLMIISLLVVLLIAAAAAFWQTKPKTHKASQTSATSTASTSKAAPVVSGAQGLVLDASKNYGDKYAGGILPVGDNMYVSDAAKPGYVYVCSGYANNLKNDSGGAGRRGPWFVGTTQYDLNKKLQVQGSVSWQAEFSDKVAGTARTITSNGLPSHPTGIFPISAADPAYAYDKNPNTIKAQSLSYSLNSAPVYSAAPNCIGGQVGIMLSGVPIFSGFDAGGRDAGAWEIQDSCQGHPEKTGTYHYHTLSSCIKDTSVKTVIGFALDGFPITGPKIADKNILTSSDLDECHGLTSQVVLDGKTVTTYHYVMTQDFPYSVACYRSTAISPPGQPAKQP